MKKLFIVFLGIIFIFMFTETSFFLLSKLIHFSRDEEVNSNNVKIVCMGDSFTYGAGVDKDASYPAILEKKLNEVSEEKIKVINYGRLAQNTSFVLKHLPDIIKKYSPEIIIIMAGYNNFANFEGAPFEKNQDAISLISEKIYKSRTYRFFELLIKNFKKHIFINNQKNISKIDFPDKSTDDLNYKEMIYNIPEKLISLNDLVRENDKLYKNLKEKRYYILKKMFEKVKISNLSEEEKIGFFLYNLDAGHLLDAQTILNDVKLKNSKYFDLLKAILDNDTEKKKLDNKQIFSLIKRYPNIKELYMMIFDLYIENDNHDKAINFLSFIKGKVKDHKNKKIFDFIIKSYSGELNEKDISSLLKERQDKSYLYEIVINNFLKKKEKIKAKKYINDYIDEFPYYYRPYLLYLNTLSKKSDEYNKISYKILELDQERLDIFESIFFDEKNFHKAKDYYLIMIKNIKNTTKYRESYIEFLIKHEKKEEALKTCEDFFNETDDVLYLKREKAYLLSLGKREKAAEVMEKIKENSLVSNDFLAEMYILKWDLKNAEKYALKSYSYKKTSQSIKRLIEVYVLAKKYNHAANKYVELYGFGNNMDKNNLVKAAEYYKAAGDFKKAEKIYLSLGMFNDAQLIKKYNFSKDSRMSIDEWIKSDVLKIIKTAKENKINLIFMNYFEMKLSVVEKVCEQNDILFLDQNEYFNAILENGAKRQDYVLPDDHLTAKGNEITAELLKEILIKRNFIK